MRSVTISGWRQSESRRPRLSPCSDACFSVKFVERAKYPDEILHDMSPSMAAVLSCFFGGDITHLDLRRG